MKLHINYDFFEAVRNVREQFGPLTLIRNNKQTFFLAVPTCGIMEASVGFPPAVVWAATMTHFGVCLLYDYIDNYKFMKDNHIEFDQYTYFSAQKLVSLTRELEEINVKTEAEFLLDAELYHETHRFILTDTKIPSIQHNQYIMIPGYNNYNGEEIDISLLQEHILGTKDYTLSVGEPEKKYKRVLVKSGA